MLNKVAPAPSQASSLWKALRTSPVRSCLAIFGLVSITAYALRKRRRVEVNGGEEVEDFTLNQQAMLKRVREIWDEHSGPPIDPKAPGDTSRAASVG